MSSGMFNLEVAKVEFRFATRQQAYPSAAGCESDGKALADSPSSAGYQNDDVLEILQKGFPR
jgi:hypothetical protein